MKLPRITNKGNAAIMAANSSYDQRTIAGRSAALLGSIGISALLFVMAAVSAHAQTAEFQANQVRITVPINSSLSTTITNILIDVTGQDTNAPVPVNLDVTGLPAGATFTLADANDNPLTSTLDDTNLYLTVHTTNVAEGIYTFSLNAFSSGGSNNVFFVLEVGRIWTGSNTVSTAWSSTDSWLGGVPGPGSHVVFGDPGAQEDPTFTNSIVDADFTVSSLRFSQTGDDAAFHNLVINGGRTLTIDGTHGFSVMRDYIDNFLFPNRAMGVTISGSRLVVNNTDANFALLVGDQSIPDHSFVNLFGLTNFVANVSRFGMGEYQLYPNFRNYNDDNDFGDEPSRFVIDVQFARTNIITATHKDADGYTNEITRTYALSLGNNEVEGNGSGVNSFIYLGYSNAFFLDSVGIARANYAIGNGGVMRFNPSLTNGTAIFRGTNNGRMTLFGIADGGAVNPATDSTRGVVDFAAGNGFVDILTDKLIIARDTRNIASNNNPIVVGNLTIGRGIVDANTAILGFQEHDGKIDWTLTGGEAYRNYCQAAVTVGSGGLFRVHGLLTLGYTADTNPEASAEQFNTRGQINITSNGVVTADTIIVDGGLNFVGSQPRANNISITQGTLIVTNTIGDAPGLPLDNLNMTAGTLTLRVTAGKTNVFVRSLLNLGSVPSAIRIASVTGVTSYPTNIPLISYESATPFLTANISGASGLDPAAQGYIINNAANKTIDLFLTTNAPQALIWAGTVNNDWDLTTKNWVTAIGGLQTNFTLGDIVTFNDTSAVTNIDIVEVVVPNQTAVAGVTIANSTRDYIFNPAGGSIAGTAKIVKQGTGKLTFDAAESGPIGIEEGTVEGSGILGSTTVYSNATLNFSGEISGGLVSTGRVTSLGSISGAVSLRGGTFVNGGFISTLPGGFSIGLNARMQITNTASGVIDVNGSGNYILGIGSTMGNFGLIINRAARMQVEGGTLFGTGTFLDPNGPLVGPDGRIQVNAINSGAIGVLSPGDEPQDSIGTMVLGNRLDLNTGNGTPNGYLGVLRIEVDFNNPSVHDVVGCDLWNNFFGMLLMTNINPGAGSFAAGQSFQVLSNNAGIGVPNNPDNGARSQMPIVSPPSPGPGLHWNLSQLRTNGLISVTSGLVWRGDVTNEWDAVSANWAGGLVYEDGLGVLFDDTATGTTDILVSITNSPASTNSTLPAIAPGIIVNNTTKQYTFSGPGRIGGPTGLYKTGPGTLILDMTNNTYNGVTRIEGGTVVATMLANVNAPSSIGAPNLGDFAQQPNGERLVLDGGTLRYVGPTVAVNRHMSLGLNGGTLDIDVSDSTNQLSVSGILSGPGGLIKTGPSRLQLTGNNTYQGVTLIDSGILMVSDQGRASTNTVILDGGGLQFSGAGAGFHFFNNIEVTADSAVIVTNTAITSRGTWSGSGDVALTVSGSLILSNSMSGYSGTISFGSSSGHLRLNSATNNNLNTGSASASFDLGSGSGTISNFNGAGLTYHLGALSGGANTILGGRVTNAAAITAATTYSIGGANTDTVFSGRIADGNGDVVSVTKVGTGKLVLDGNNTYTGPTTVTAGTLGGSGSIAGSLTVDPGATLAPGSSVGTFTVGGAVTLAGATVMELDRGAVPQNDRLVAPSITAGGTLTVNDIGPTLINGTVFQLFSVPVSGFTSVTLPAGYTWTDNLAVDGSIQLIAGGINVNPNPTNITATVNGNVLTLSWPSSHIGWQLWSNAVGLLETNMWFPVNGAAATNQMDFNINLSKTNVFYRMVLP